MRWNNMTLAGATFAAAAGLGMGGAAVAAAKEDPSIARVTGSGVMVTDALVAPDAAGTGERGWATRLHWPRGHRGG